MCLKINEFLKKPKEVNFSNVGRPPANFLISFFFAGFLFFSTRIAENPPTFFVTNFIKNKLCLEESAVLLIYQPADEVRVTVQIQEGGTFENREEVKMEILSLYDSEGLARRY